MALSDLKFWIRSRFDAAGAEAAKKGVREVGEAADDAGRQGANGMGFLQGALGKVKAGALAVVAALVAVAKAFVDAAIRGAEFAQELHLVSVGLGISEGRARELERAMNRVGMDMSDLRGIVAGLNSAVGEAIRGNESYAEAFRGLGLEVVALQGLSTEDLLDRITTALLKLGDIDASEFSFVSQLLGDDDAARIIAAAKEIKAGLLAELKISDEQVRSALNRAAWISDAENIGEDIALGIAGFGAGGSDRSKWIERTEDGLAKVRTLHRENARKIRDEWITVADEVPSDLQGKFELAFSNVGTSAGALVNIARLRSGETAKAWLASIRSIDRGHAELRDKAIASFRAMADAADIEARRARAAWQSVSYTTPTVRHPAAQRGIGAPNQVDEDGNVINTENDALDLVRINNENAMEFDPVTGEFLGPQTSVSEGSVTGRMALDEAAASRVNSYNQAAATETPTRSSEPDYSSGDFGL